MTTQYQCRSCNERRDGEPFQSFDVASPLGNVYTHDLCCGPCLIYWEADRKIPEHYEYCRSQDDMRDPPCRTCADLHEDKRRAKRTRDSYLLRRACQEKETQIGSND